MAVHKVILELGLKAKDAMKPVLAGAMRGLTALGAHAKAVGAGIARHLGNAFRTLTSPMAMLAGGAGLAGLGYGVKSYLTGAVQIAGQWEGYLAKLTVALKSATKAAAAFEWAKQFAATTPFEMGEVVDATTRLEMYGLSAKKWIPLVGDMAGAMGKNITDAVEAIADAVSGGGLERLKEFGISSTQLLKAGAKPAAGGMGVSYMGQDAIDALKKALISIMSSRYGGGMTKLLVTWQGKTSNLADAWNQLKGRIGQGMLPVLKKIVDMTTAWINKLLGSGLGERLGKTLGVGIGKAFAAIAKLMPYIERVLTGDLIPRAINAMATGFVWLVEQGVKFVDYVLPRIPFYLAKASEWWAKTKDWVSRVKTELENLLGLNKELGEQSGLSASLKAGVAYIGDIASSAWDIAKAFVNVQNVFDWLQKGSMILQGSWMRLVELALTLSMHCSAIVSLLMKAAALAIRMGTIGVFGPLGMVAAKKLGGLKKAEEYEKAAKWYEAAAKLVGGKGGWLEQWQAKEVAYKDFIDREWKRIDAEAAARAAKYAGEYHRRTMSQVGAEAKAQWGGGGGVAAAGPRPGAGTPGFARDASGAWIPMTKEEWKASSFRAEGLPWSPARGASPAAAARPEWGPGSSAAAPAFRGAEARGRAYAPIMPPKPPAILPPIVGGGGAGSATTGELKKAAYALPPGTAGGAAPILVSLPQDQLDAIGKAVSDGLRARGRAEANRPLYT